MNKKPDSIKGNFAEQTLQDLHLRIGEDLKQVLSQNEPPVHRIKRENLLKQHSLGAHRCEHKPVPH